MNELPFEVGPLIGIIGSAFVTFLAIIIKALPNKWKIILSFLLLGFLAYCILSLLGFVKWFQFKPHDPIETIVLPVSSSDTLSNVTPPPPVVVGKKSQENEKKFNDYSSGLKDDNDGVRLRALKNFYILACEDPSDFLSDVCNVFCSHIRNKTEQSDYIKKYGKTPSIDTQYILDKLFKKDSIGLIFENLDKHLHCSYLFGADFNGATLNNVFFDEANLTKAEFDNAILSTVCFNLAKISNVDFDKAILKENVSFENAEISNSYFRDKSLKDVNFQKSKIFLSSFTKSTLSDVNFENARIDASNFDDTVMTNVSFRNDTLKGVSFRHVSYSKVNFTNAKFFKCDLWTNIKPKKEDVIFTGTIFDNEKDNISKITSYDYTIRRNNK